MHLRAFETANQMEKRISALKDKNLEMTQEEKKNYELNK